MEKTVLNIPHSSTAGIFDRRLGGWKHNQDFVNKSVRRLTDWYTDYLFSTDRTDVVPVVFPYSRFVVDVERLPDDRFCKPGEGIIYTEIDGFRRREPDDSARQTLLALREQHINNLKQEITPGTVLLDCHSYSGGTGDPDICLGFNDDSTFDQKLVESVSKAFCSKGYTVAYNSPFVGCLAPDTGFRYRALMIEVHKRVYLSETTLSIVTDPRKLTRWFGTVEDIYKLISDYNPEQ